MKEKLIKDIIVQCPYIEESSYIAEFNMLYGDIWEITTVTDAMEQEILLVEIERIKNHEVQLITPLNFVKQYSFISFYLAQQHWYTKKIYEVARILNTIFLNFLDGGFLKNNEQKLLRHDISETTLDFKFASGADNISSIRMIPFIENKLA